jgi:2-oxoglutarate ferredoxin oxidoreductase subunit alpha
VAEFDYGRPWAEIEGDGDIAVVTWGVASRAVQNAVRQLGEAGKRIRVVTLRLLAPARPDMLAAALDGASHMLVVELNHRGQLYQFLKGSWDLPADAETLHRPGPRLIRPGELMQKLRELTQ